MRSSCASGLGSSLIDLTQSVYLNPELMDLLAQVVAFQFGVLERNFEFIVEGFHVL
jgi:hypothetical protein